MSRYFTYVLYSAVIILGIGRVQGVLAQTELDVDFLESEVVKIESGELERNFYAARIHSKQKSDAIWPLRRLKNGWFIASRDSIERMISSGVQLSLKNVNDDWKKSENIANTPQQGEFLIWGESSTALAKRLTDELIANTPLENGVFKVFLTPSLFTEVIAWKEVHYIGDEQLHAEPESRVLDLNLVPNRIRQLYHHYSDLRGEGQLVSIKENAYDSEDLDLWGRSIVTPNTAEDVDSHTTDMATILAGGGSSSILGLGVAPRASITSSYLEDLFPDGTDYFSEWNIQIQNHSYGTRIENFYGVLASAYDSHAWENPRVLHVFSAGNAGLEEPTDGVYSGVKGYANLTGNFKMAKNTILVGAVDTVGKLVEFTSNGPAYDGRIKPDIVAYSVFGSSNAAALTSGVSALIQEKFQLLNGHAAPAALLKAVLINSAKDVHSSGPDFKTGFGSLNAYRAMRTIDEEKYFHGKIEGQLPESFVLQIPSGLAEFKATLVWHDPAASINSSQALVHDLDFQIVDSTGEVWQPLTLNPDVDQLSTKAVMGRDSLNNVEQIVIPNPTSTELTFNVRAFNELIKAQEFYIAFQWDKEEQFEWVFPTASDQMPYNGETTGYFRWESTLSAEEGSLSISYDDGNTWQLITENLDISEGHYRWRPTDTTTLAKAKIVAEGHGYVSNEFVIHPTSFPKIGYYCADSTRLAWKQEPAALAYEVLNWREGQMETIATTADTAMVFYKGDLNSPFLAVRSVLRGGKRTIASPAINYESGTGCYLNTFVISETEEAEVQLQFELGTVAGIDEVRIYHRFQSGKFELLDRLAQEGLSQRTSYLHSQPVDGYNGYEIELIFENGERLRSQELSIYWLNVLQAAVFPNPVESGGDMNVFLKDEPRLDQAFFTLFNSSGNILFSEPLIAKGYSFRIPDLAKGIYFYRVSNGLGTQRGRLIVK